MASFTLASLARSRIVVPRNPFLANSSIAACKISCRRSCFISKYSLTSVVSTYLRHLKDLCKEKQALESATCLLSLIPNFHRWTSFRNRRVVNQLNQDPIRIVKVERPRAIAVCFGFGGQSDAGLPDAIGPLIDVFRMAYHKPNMMEGLYAARFAS